MVAPRSRPLKYSGGGGSWGLRPWLKNGRVELNGAPRAPHRPPLFTNSLVNIDNSGRSTA
jgi:hypothetical protein